MATKNQTRIARLKRLRNVILPRVPRGHFNMNVWAYKNKCGTTACALGWAGLDPSFRRAGLKTSIEEGRVYLNNRYAGVDAALMFFNITYEETTNLFLWSASKRSFRNKITRIIRKYENDDAR